MGSRIRNGYGLLCGLVLGLLGCAVPAQRDLHLPQGPKITLHADPAFTEPERKCLQDAADQWRNDTGGMAEATYVYDLPKPDVFTYIFTDRVVRWTSDMEVTKDADKGLVEQCQNMWPAEKCDAFTIYGQVNSKTNFSNGLPVEMRIVVDRVPQYHTCKLTVMHELGHIWGLDHDPNPSAIMYRSVDDKRKDCLKAYDTNAFCSLYDCRGVFMTPCGD